MSRLLRGEWGPAILSEYVFLEVVTVLLLRQSLATAVEVGQILLSAREIEFVPGADVFLESWQIFRDQQRTKLSFTDAAILSIARLKNADAIATFDRSLARASGRQIVP